MRSLTIAGRKQQAADRPSSRRFSGWAYFDMGQLKEAESAFREANRLDPKDANVLLVLGLVADRQGKPDEAREAWQRAAALGGDSEAGAEGPQNLANLDARLAGRGATAATVRRSMRPVRRQRPARPRKSRASTSARRPTPGSDVTP